MRALVPSLEGVVSGHGQVWSQVDGPVVQADRRAGGGDSHRVSRLTAWRSSYQDTESGRTNRYLSVFTRLKVASTVNDPGCVLNCVGRTLPIMFSLTGNAQQICNSSPSSR